MTPESFRLLEHMGQLFGRQSHMLLMVVDMKQMRYQYVGPNAYTVVGIEARELVEKGPGVGTDLMHPEDRNAFSQVADQLQRLYTDLSPDELQRARISFLYRSLNPVLREYRWLASLNVSLDFDDANTLAYQTTLVADVQQLKVDNAPRWSFLLPDAHGHYHEQLRTPSTDAVLTSRELDILRLLCAGHNSRVVAQRLGIAVNTVNTHRKSMRRKTGAANTPELVQYALRHGLL